MFLHSAGVLMQDRNCLLFNSKWRNVDFFANLPRGFIFNPVIILTLMSDLCASVTLLINLRIFLPKYNSHYNKCVHTEIPTFLVFK